MPSGPMSALSRVLSVCLKAAGLSTHGLAVCLISRGFRPGGVTDATVLAGLLDDVVAGQRWPFSIDDLSDFNDHCKTCLKRAGRRRLFALALELARLAAGFHVP